MATTIMHPLLVAAQDTLVVPNEDSVYSEKRSSARASNARGGQNQSPVLGNWICKFSSLHSYENPFKIRNKVETAKAVVLSRDDIKSYEKRMQYDRWYNGGEKNLHKVVVKWCDKKLKETGEEIELNQGILRFLIGNDFHEQVKKEKIPKEFSSCRVPNVEDKGEHYYIDGTPIPGHTRDSLRDLVKLRPEIDIDMLPKVHRLAGFQCPNYLAPFNSKDEPFYMSASACACQWWKLAYAGQMPPDTFECFFNEATITYQNKGFVREEMVNLEANLNVIRRTYDEKKLWPYFHPLTAAYVVSKLELNDCVDEEDEYVNLCASSFVDQTVIEQDGVAHLEYNTPKNLPPKQTVLPGKIVEIEEIFDEEPVIKLSIENPCVALDSQLILTEAEVHVEVPVKLSMTMKENDAISFLDEENLHEDIRREIRNQLAGAEIEVLERYSDVIEYPLVVDTPEIVESEPLKIETVISERESTPLKDESPMYRKYGNMLYKRLAGPCGKITGRIVGSLLELNFPTLKALIKNQIDFEDSVMTLAVMMKDDFACRNMYSIINGRKSKSKQFIPSRRYRRKKIQRPTEPPPPPPLKIRKATKKISMVPPEFVNVIVTDCQTRAKPKISYIPEDLKESIVVSRPRVFTAEKTTNVYPDSITPIKSSAIQTDNVVFADEVDWEGFEKEVEPRYVAHVACQTETEEDVAEYFEELPFAEVQSGSPFESMFLAMPWTDEVMNMTPAEFRAFVERHWNVQYREEILMTWSIQKERWNRRRVQHFVPGLNPEIRLNGGNDTEEVNDETIIQEANLKLVDERIVQTTSTHGNDIVQNMELYSNMAEQPWSLGEVVSRPLRLGTYKWANQATGATITTVQIPGSILKVSTLPQSAIPLNFQFFRSDFQIRVQVNGTKFHNGRLIAFLVPPLWDTDNNYYVLNNCTCFPHVFLDASSNNSGVINVPFIHMLSHFTARRNVLQSDSMNTLGRVFLRVYNQLRFGTGASSELSATVWIKYVNPQFHYPIPTFTTVVSPNGLFDGKVNADPLKIPPFGSEVQGSDFLGSFVNSMGRGLGGAVAGAIATFTGGLDLGIGNMIGAYFVDGMIYDKPRMADLPKEIINQSVQAPCHGAGFDHSTRLALTNVSVTFTDPNQLGTKSPDFTLKTLLQLPCLMSRITWTTSDAVGDFKLRLPVCPTLITAEQNSLSGNVATYSPSMLAYISRAFCYWRGSIVYKFQVISTMYHSGRILVSHVPSLTHAKGMTFSHVLNTQNGIVYDIEEKKEFEVRIPYVSVRPWLRCDSLRSYLNFENAEQMEQDSIGTSYCGDLFVHILNRLVCPANVSQTVDINVFVMAGEDFELAVPNSLHPLNVTDKLSVAHGRSITYPFVVDKTKRAELPVNKEEIQSMFFEGLIFYRQGIIKDGSSYWYEATVMNDSDKFDEINVWIYKVGKLKGFIDGKWLTTVKYMQSFGKYADFKTYAEVQAGETMLTNREEQAPQEVITKEASTPSVAPYTLSENAMNLQTIMRRYYPLLNSFEFRNIVGYTMVQLPVIPNLCPVIRKPIVDAFAEPVPVHLIAWFARLFTWWRGSMRYMLTFNDGAPDVEIIHIPTEARPFEIMSGVSELEVQRLMSFAGTIDVTHVGASRMIEVPFFSAYNMLLMDAHNDHPDLRAQNGTLYILFRNRYNMVRPTTFSIFMSIGDDFVMDVLKAPPKIFEYSTIISDCTNVDDPKLRMKLMNPEFNISVSDAPRRVQTPRECGYRYLQFSDDLQDNIVNPGPCIPAYPPVAGASGMPEIQGLTDYILPEETRRKMDCLMNNANDTLDTIQTCANNLNTISTTLTEKKTVDELTTTLTSVNDLLSKLKSAPVPAAETKLATYTKISIEIVAIGGVLINLRKCIEEPSLANFITLGLCLSALFSLMGRQLLTGLFESIIGWLFRSNGEGPGEVESGPADFVENNEGSILTCVAIFGTVCYAAIFGAIPSWKKLKKYLKEFFEGEKEVCSSKTPEVEAGWLNLKEVHFSMLGITALEKVFNKIYELVAKFINWILDRENPEYAAARVALEQKEKLLHVIREVDELDDEQQMMLALKDPFINNRFYKLLDDSRELMDVCLSDSKVSQRLFTTLSRYNSKVERLVQMLHKNEPPNDRRYDPYCICLHGESGCGKSEIMTDFIDLMAEVMDLPKYNRVYSKGIVDKYWSGYKQQPVVIWDEFAQNRDADIVIPEFVTLKSCLPLKVNMADVKEKGRFFTSQGIIMATNVAYAHIDVMRDLSAYQRRRNVIVGFKLKAGHTALTMAELPHRHFKDFEHIDFSIRDQYEDRPIDADHAHMNFAQVKDFVRRSMSTWHNKQLISLIGTQTQAMPRGVKAIQVVNGETTPLPIEDMRELMAQYHATVAPSVSDVESSDDETEEEHEEEPIAQAGNTTPLLQKPCCSKQILVDDEMSEYGAFDIKFDLFVNQSEKEIQFVEDNEVTDLSEEEKDDRDFFLDDPSLFNQCKAFVRTKVGKIKESRAYGICQRFMIKCSEIVTQFFTDHPVLFSVVGTLSLLVATAGVAYAVSGTGNSESSYDYHGKTHFARRVMPAANAAYDSNPKARTNHRVLASVHSSSDPCAADIQHKFHRNVYIISWADGPIRTMRCVQLCGTIILLPRHFFAGRSKGQVFFLAHRVVNVNVYFDPDKVMFDENKDWCLYDCGQVLEPCKHVVKYFISEEHLGKIRKTDCCVATVNDYMEQVSYFGMCEPIQHYAYNDSQYGETYVQSGWKYTNLSTGVGHCGSPLICYNTMLPTPGKILGIHVAGYVKRNEGFSVLISREQIEAQLEKFEPQMGGIARIEAMDLSRDPLTECRILPDGDYSIMGVMPNKFCLSQPLKTSFRETPWFEEVFEERPPPKVPAYLKPFINGNERISPLAVGLRKYGKEVFPFPPRNLKKIEIFMTNLLENKLQRHLGKVIYDERDAILGIDGLPFCDKMNMKSSPGWPYQIYNKSTHGKWHLFDENGGVKNDYLRFRLDERLAHAKEGKRIPSLWRDCLKDELRPVEKVKSGKTRLFTIAPVDFTILVRRYFLDFVVAFYNANNDKFFSAVGITPESAEWTKMFDYLAEHSQKCVAGDFRNFDGCIHPDLIELFITLVNNWYADGEENARVRRVIMNEVIHTCHLVENCVYCKHKGNPSGNPLTAVMNTIINFIIILLMFLEIYPDATLQDFLDWIHFIAYGDDHLFTVSKKFEKFNFNSIKVRLLKYGIEYTTDKKDDSETPDFIALKDATFLKRGFRQDPEFGMSFQLPTMSKDTIESFFYYYRFADDVQEQLQDNMKSALDFARFYGRQYYDQLQEKWQNLMRKHNLEPICISFEEQVDVFHAASYFISPSTKEPVLLAKRKGRQVEGMDKFMELTNSKLARALCAVVEAPLYYACASVGIQCKGEDFPRTDNRWAAAIPSGEGKSTLCKKYPHVFVDHDELLIPEFGAGSLIKGLPWSARQARTKDFPIDDRRILLVHSADNTKRQMIGSFITHFPTFIRTNILGRLQQRGARRMSMASRNQMLLITARQVEPSLFLKQPG